MSTQLIIYPQYYQGFNSINITTNEFVVDGLNFNHMDSSTTYTSSGSIDDHLYTTPPGLINTWYRWRNSGPPLPAFPVKSGNNLIFNAVAPSSLSGVYMQLANLIVGASYTLTVNMTPEVGALLLKAFNLTNNSVIATAYVTSNITQQTLTFTAETTTDTIAIIYNNTSATNLTVSSISVIPTGQAPTQVYTDLEDGQVICDLYEEEDIPLTLSIDDFKNVTEKVQSYSKDFNLPATKRNNRIFNNMFDVTRSDDGIIFNPYVKTKCVLKQDGFILFEGYLRLIDVKDKEGEISYNVNLYSEVIALADILKDQVFSDLDFSELEHIYDKSSIKNSWKEPSDGIGLPLLNSLLTSSFAYNALLGVNQTNVLKYPFIDWTGQYPISAIGTPQLYSLQQAFRPCIQLKYLINKIFAGANFTYTSDFFDSAEFENLFMDFNWGEGITPSSIPSTSMGKYRIDDTTSVLGTTFSNYHIEEDNFLNYGTSSWGFDTSTNRFTCPAGQTNTTIAMSYNCRFRCASETALTDNIDLRWKLVKGGITQYIDAVTNQSINGSASAVPDIVYATYPFNNIDTINIIDGGYYTVAPTITIVGGSNGFYGSDATATCTIDGSGQVDSITVTNQGSGYFYGAEIIFNSVNPFFNYAGSFSVDLDVGDTLEMEMKANTTNSVRQDNDVPPKSNPGSVGPSGTWVGQISAASIVRGVLISHGRSSLNQWGFLKGLMTMFNLVTMVDETNPDNILIEPYSDVFINNTNSGNTGNLTLASRGVQHDWTDKVDVSQMDLNPLTDLNNMTIFQFVEDEDDYAFSQYKNSTSGHLYGSKEIDASGFTLLQGTKEIVVDTFAATIVKPLIPQMPNFVVPCLYARSDNGQTEGFENSPRILYNNGVKYTGASYNIPAQNSLPSENQQFFLQFSHLSSIPSDSTISNDYLFESTQLFNGVGDAPVNNLYSTYWSPYFNQLYSPDTRIMKLKVNLTPADVASFKFYDTVFIKNRVFRVNKIEYKPNTLAKVEFILIP